MVIIMFFALPRLIPICLWFNKTNKTIKHMSKPNGLDGLGLRVCE